MKGAPWSISELLGLWLVTSKDQGADPPSSREQVAQKFTGGIGNKLCGECLRGCPGEGGGHGQAPRSPRRSKPPSHLRIPSGVGYS